MTKDFKNSGLISQVAEFIDKKRIEEGISIDTLCQSAHISKRIYIDPVVWILLKKVLFMVREHMLLCMIIQINMVTIRLIR